MSGFCLRVEVGFWRAPDGLARRTAGWLVVDALVANDLAEIDYGAWRGRALDDVARDEPYAFKVWLDDPKASWPGGKSFSDLLSRVGGWPAANQSLAGHSVAIASASVVNACVLASLGAPATAFFRRRRAAFAIEALERRPALERALAD